MQKTKLIFILIILIALAVFGGIFLRENTKKNQPAISTSQSVTITGSQSATPVVSKSASSTIPVIKPTQQAIEANTSGIQVMAWIYPGKPACNAPAEYSDGRKIQILKPQYFSIGDQGALVLQTTASAGCNGYSAANLTDIKKYSQEQFATISSSDAGNMDLFTAGALANTNSINTLVNFVITNNMTGIEIDFEDFGGWTASSYAHYKAFITALGNALHQKGKQLMIDGPAESNQTEEQWYQWRYADFTTLPVDSVVVMTYDYQFDQGAGTPIAPLDWIQNVISWVTSKFPNKNKLTIGIPSYGYKSTVGTQQFTLLTYDQIKLEPGFSTATRDASSGEMTWKNGNSVYFYQDSTSMQEKLAIVEKNGINSVSVWHLGGNLWF